MDTFNGNMEAGVDVKVELDEGDNGQYGRYEGSNYYEEVCQCCSVLL